MQDDVPGRTDRSGSGPVFGAQASAEVRRLVGETTLDVFPSVSRSWKLASAWMYDLAYDGSGDVPGMHAHPEAVFELVLRGSYRERYWRTDRYPGVGSVVYTAPGVEHGDASTGGAVHVFTIKVDADGSFDDPEPDLIAMNAGPLVRRLYIESSNADASSALVAESLLSELRSGLCSRGAPRSHPAIGRTVEALHEAVDRVPTLAELAPSAGLSPRHLARSFRLALGCTPGCYHRRLRLERAASRLFATDDPISTIALDLGFSDQSHFGRHFKRRYGMSPYRFRKASLGSSAV